MKKLFTQLQQKLCSVYGEPPKGHALKRVNCLSGLIAGMVRKGSPHMSDIGKGLPKDTNAHSKEIAAKRFLNNKWVDYEANFLPFITCFLRAVLAFLPPGHGLRLVVDGSQTGKHHATLMVSLVWRRRGIPLCWFVKKGGKGHFSSEDHLEVFNRAKALLLPLLPPGTPVTLLGDGEFDSIGLQEACLGIGWDYVLRTACSTILYEGGTRFSPKGLEASRGTGVLFIPDVEFTEKRFRYVNFVCWHESRKHDEPIFLVSSLPEAGDIIGYYDERFSIECLFRDIKSTSFNVHKTRLRDTAAVSNLIMVAALAFILLLYIGVEYEYSPLRKKVQRVRADRDVLSIFSFALEMLDYLIDNDIGFSFSFQFSKNYASFFQQNE